MLQNYHRSRWLKTKQEIRTGLLIKYVKGLQQVAGQGVLAILFCVTTKRIRDAMKCGL